MKLRYTVHSSNPEEFTVKATVAGREVDAKIQGLVVELTSEDGGMGHTYKFGPENIAKAQELFAPGAAIDVSFTAAK